MEPMSNEFKVESHSWRVSSPSLAEKLLDRSAFLHHGTGIPVAIRSFFGCDKLAADQKQGLVLTCGNEAFDAYIEMRAEPLERTRLFWHGDFARFVNDRFPEAAAAYRNNEAQSLDAQSMFFLKGEGDGAYEISFEMPTPTAMVTEKLWPSDGKENNDDSIQAWLLLTIRGARQYAGNSGYEDELEKVYRFDSFVANSKKVREGDLAILRDTRGALGVAEIRKLKILNGSKTRNRCPLCGIVRLKARRKLQPKYRCENGHVFDEPQCETVPCTEYEAHFEDSFAPVVLPISAPILRGACSNFVGQFSIQPISILNLLPILRLRVPGVMDILQELPAHLGAEQADKDGDYVISSDDVRKRVSRQIALRRGQQRFRNITRATYNDACVISGCKVVDVLEAAHIRPYRSPKDNHPANGLLLRADLHTLFDLDLLGIEPETLRVHVASSLRNTEYANLAGRTLHCGRSKPSADALHFRWTVFQSLRQTCDSDN